MPIPHCPREEEGDGPVRFGTRRWKIFMIQEKFWRSPGRNAFQETNVFSL